MFTRCAVVVIVLVTGACSTHEEVPEDRMPPALTWGLGHGDQPVAGLADRSPRIRDEIDAALVFYVRADDDSGLAHLSLSGIGTFRCSTRDGSWVAPYDIIVPLSDSEAAALLAETRARPDTYAHLAVPLQVSKLSCGRQTVPGLAEDQELVPRAGSVLLRAYAVDTAGLSSEAVLTLLLRSTLPPAEVAALNSRALR